MIANCRDRRAGLAAAHRGTVLVVVLVVVTMISLGSYALVESMYVEHKAARVYGERLQIEQALASAAERLAALAELPPAELAALGGLLDNPGQFRDLPLIPRTAGGGEGADEIWLSVVAPANGGELEPSVRYGAHNESARLNLAAVWQWEAQRAGAGRAALLQLPGMTEAAADAILDWLDPDSQPRPHGAEHDYYAKLPTPYAPRNGLPTDLAELLLVKSVTPELLLGRHASSAATDRAEPVPTTAPGVPANRPWHTLLTLSSGERQVRPDGRPRIDLNAPDLARLQQQLSESLSPTLAQFVVALRQFGPYAGNQPGEDAGGLAANTAVPPRFMLVTPLDVVGAKVAVPGAGAAPKVYASPLRADLGQGSESLLAFCDQVTIGPEPVLRGRVNVNLAPEEVLRGVPGLHAAHVQAVLAARGDARSAASPQRRHAIWLWTEGLVDLETMKRLYPYLTAGGDVHRARVVARDASGRQLAAAEVVVDATGRPARIRSLQRDWTVPQDDPPAAAGERGEPFARAAANRASHRVGTSP